MRSNETIGEYYDTFAETSIVEALRTMDTIGLLIEDVTTA